MAKVQNTGSRIDHSYANHYKRIEALIIDCIVLSPLFLFHHLNAIWLKSMPILAIIAVLYALYKPIMESRYGATLGKKVRGIKVVNKLHTKPNTKEAIIRSLPFTILSFINLLQSYTIASSTEFVSPDGLNPLSILNISKNMAEAILFLVAGSWTADVIMLLVNRQKQSLHDYLAGTYVIGTKAKK